MHMAHLPTRFVAFSVMLLLIVAPADAAPPSDPPRGVEELVDWQMGQLVDRGCVVGAAVGVIMEGKTQSFYYGRVRKKNGQAPDPSTLFEIGSITKAFTGTLLADMVNKGMVRLDEPVQDLLPEGVTVPSLGERAITLEDLATQSSGLPRMPDNFQGPKGNPYVTYGTDEMYAFLNGYTLPRAPGTQYEYSNLGAGLAGVALSRRAGTPYEQLIFETICAPLGMTDTCIVLDEDRRARLAQGYSLAFDLLGLRVHHKQQPWDFDAFQAAGAIRSTLPDMMRFLAAAMGGESGLRSAFDMAEEGRFQIGDSAHVGLFWHVSENEELGGPLVWHNGQTGGYHAFLGFVRKTGAGVVILANTAEMAVDTAGQTILAVIPRLPAE